MCIFSMWVQDITGLIILNFVMPKINYCSDKCSLNLFLNTYAFYYSSKKRNMVTIIMKMLSLLKLQANTKIQMMIWKIFSLMKYQRTEMKPKIVKEKNKKQLMHTLRLRDLWRVVSTVLTLRIC